MTNTAICALAIGLMIAIPGASAQEGAKRDATKPSAPSSAAPAAASPQPASQYPENKQVSRLPALSEPLDPIVKKLFDKRRAMGGAVINLSLVQSHAPKLAEAHNAAAFALRFDAITPRSLRELIILRTAQIAGSAYEINQHTPMMKMCGYTPTQIAEVARWKRSKLFDEKQRAALAYVEQMAHGGNVDDATWANLAHHFNPQEIMEITFTVSNYYGTALLTKALRLQIEDDGRLTVAGKC